ncbi:hypothetical protein V7P28_25385, partial [Klebsiella michiganensis]
MKKLAITCALLSSFVVSQVWADAASQSDYAGIPVSSANPLVTAN